MIRNVCRAAAGAALVIAIVPPPAAAESAAAVVTLSHAEFSATLAPGNTMSCTGLPTRTCTHKWDSTLCFEAVADTAVGSLGCDVKTVTSPATKTRGTGVSNATGVHCTTTNFGTELEIYVTVSSVFFGAADVRVTAAQTDGVGSFSGSRALLDRTVFVEGTFSTVGTDPGPCGTATTGSLRGTFTVTTPV